MNFDRKFNSLLSYSATAVKVVQKAVFFHILSPPPPRKIIVLRALYLILLQYKYSSKRRLFLSYSSFVIFFSSRFSCIIAAVHAREGLTGGVS
jgi:hypothetical protein